MNARGVVNRRTRQDRRSHEEGPAQGQEERRKAPERRHPEVEHVEFDECIEVPPVKETPEPC